MRQTVAMAALTGLILAGAAAQSRNAGEQGYIDSALCVGCHAEIAKTYRLSGMGRSFYRARPGPGYAKAFTVFGPKLRAAGVKEETLHGMYVDNPRRFFAFVPKKSRSS